LTHGQAYHKTSSMKLLINEESMCMRDSERTSLRTPAKLKCLFGFITLHNWHLSEPLTVYHGKHVMFHVCLCYLKGYKVSKSEGTRKVE